MNSIRILLAVSAIGVVAQAHSATKVYEVDAAYRQEVVEILSRMLDIENRELRGSVQLLPSGQVVVDTITDERQAEVALVLEAIAEAETGATPTVTLRYWMLQATRGTEDSVFVPDVLDDVIRELEAVYGDIGISNLDAAIVSGRAGRQAFLETEAMEIMQTPYVNEDELNASIFIDAEIQELMVDVSLTSGEFLVLNSSSTGDGMLAIIVSWPGNE